VAAKWPSLIWLQKWWCHNKRGINSVLRMYFKALFANFTNYTTIHCFRTFKMVLGGHLESDYKINETRWKSATVDSRYLEIEGTGSCISRYQNFEITKLTKMSKFSSGYHQEVWGRGWASAMVSFIKLRATVTFSNQCGHLTTTYIAKVLTLLRKIPYPSSNTIVWLLSGSIKY
jgi:hypothetical protein